MSTNTITITPELIEYFERDARRMRSAYIGCLLTKLLHWPAGFVAKARGRMRPQGHSAKPCLQY